MDEVLQPSGLHNYYWPDKDPLQVGQKFLQLNDKLISKVKLAATNVVFDFKAFEKNTRNKSIAEKIHFILTSKKFQFNPTQSLKKELIWLDRIKKFVNQLKPIQLVYPLMCKIGNWAKQMTNIGPNAGELSTLYFFENLNRIIKRIYPPGIIIFIICDAQLYNSAFQNTEIEVNRYISECEKMISKLGFNHFIKFHNYVNLLADSNYYKKYIELHHYYFRVINTQQPEKVLKNINVPTLFQSVKASINTRKLHLNYYEHKEIFGSKEQNQNAISKKINNMTKTAFQEVVAIRSACSKLNIFEDIFPNHIRVTCHKGLKNGLAVIGLRPYPEYYGSSKLLPYHGVPLIKKSKYGAKLKIEIHPEIVLRGNNQLIRILDSDNCTFFYDETILNK